MIEEEIQKYIPEDLILGILSYKKIHQIPCSFDKYKSQIQKEKAIIIQKFLKRVLLRNLAYEWFYYKVSSKIPSKVNKLITKEMLLYLLTYYHKDNCLRDYTYTYPQYFVNKCTDDSTLRNNKKIYDDITSLNLEYKSRYKTRYEVYKWLSNPGITKEHLLYAGW
jgi:hypothetical protein